MNVYKIKYISRRIILLNILLILILILSLYKVFVKSTTSNNLIDQQSVLENAQEIANICQRQQQRDCYKKQLSQLSLKKGIFFVEKTLNALQEIDPNMRSCHGFAHEVAKLIVYKDPDKWKELLSQVNPNTCGGGLMHGIIESHTGFEPNTRVDSNLIKETCLNQSSRWSSACVHTFGHIALLQTEGEVAQALPICEDLPSDTATNCFNGLFMEDSFKTNLIEHGLVEKVPIPTKDQQSFERVSLRCSQYQGPAGIGCWADLGPIFVEYYKYDYQRIYNECEKADEEAEQRHCYFRAVASLAIYGENDTASKLMDICSPYFATNKDAYKRCIIYLSASLVYNSANFTKRAITFCSALLSEYQEDCFKAIGVVLRNITSENEREIFCREVEEKFKSLCINGNQEGKPKLSPFGVF